MDTALSIIGFYFALIGFISGLFFTRLDSWYGDVREFYGSYSGEDPAKKNTPDNCRKNRIKQMGLEQSTPLGSFVVVGLLTTALTLLSWGVPITDPQMNTFLFLRLPLILTVLVYWIGGFILLSKSQSLLTLIKTEIDKVLGPLPKP